MDQCRRLQRVPVTLFAQATRRKLTKLPVHERCQLIQCLLVAVSPFDEKASYLMGSRHGPNLLIMLLCNVWPYCIPRVRPPYLINATARKMNEQ